MGKKPRKPKNRVKKVKQVDDAAIKQIEKMENRLSEEDNNNIEEVKKVIDQQIKEHDQNVDRYCKSVELSTKKLAQDMAGGIMWLDDEKKVMAFIQQISVLAGQLIKTQPEKYQITKNLRELIQVFTTNAILRTEHDFFRKIGY